MVEKLCLNLYLKMSLEPTIHTHAHTEQSTSIASIVNSSTLYPSEDEILCAILHQESSRGENLKVLFCTHGKL